MSNNNSMVRMRVLNELYAELKSIDPQTNVSKHFIRQLAISGKVPVVQVGRKRLISLDGVIDFLNNSSNIEDLKTEQCGKIRRVNA